MDVKTEANSEFAESATFYRGLYIFALNPATVPSESSERYWCLDCRKLSLHLWHMV